MQSSPSGHCSTSTGNAVALAVAYPPMAVPVLLSSGCIAWASVYTWRHYVSDAWVGIAWGTLVGLLYGLSARALARRIRTQIRHPALGGGFRRQIVWIGHESPRSHPPRQGLDPACPARAGPLLVPGTSSLPLIDRDEPRFAQATREMVDNGEWIIPTFNHDVRFDKPVLTYWMMRGGYVLFGVNEFGARFHSMVCTLLLILKETEIELDDVLEWKYNHLRGRNDLLHWKDHRGENKQRLAEAGIPPGWIDRIEGWNVARSSWVTVVCVRCPGVR